MVDNYKKKLIEVAIPLEAINKASERDKNLSKGHPKTIHMWWAPRPMPACRAILFAQLVDDPSSDPDRFPSHEAVEKERNRLFKIMEELITWENSTNDSLLDQAREEILKSCSGKVPPIIDPFSGGAAIPLEAQRLGLRSYASDLNPVAVLIGKCKTEIPWDFSNSTPVHPGAQDRLHYKYAEGIAEDILFYSRLLRERAYSEIGNLYPKIQLPSGHSNEPSTVIAWIWTRTVPSPDPAFSGVHVPIASSFALSTKKGKEVFVNPLVDKSKRSITYRIERQASEADIQKAKEGTKAGRGAHFRCLFSNAAITPEYVRSKGKEGEIGQALLAVVAEGKSGRVYIEPTLEDESIAFSAKPDWKPDQKQPDNPRWFSPPIYGMETFGSLFTDRQLVALNTFTRLLDNVQNKVELDAIASGMTSDTTPLSAGGKGAFAYSEAVRVYLALGISRLANRSSTLSFWDSGGQKIQQGFGRQAIPMTWDFVEGNPFSNSSGNFIGQIEYLASALKNIRPVAIAECIQADAQSRRYPDDAVISTDPPYYDNIGYADLSDFFYVWLRPSLKGVFPSLFSTISVPKSEELVATPYRHGGKNNAEAFFLEGMKEVLKNAAANTSSQYPTTIYYAFKQGEKMEEGTASTGWATFLEAVISSGYSVVGTWPIRSESTRNLKKTKNALSNSVVLVCRKRQIEAETVTRAEFIRALKKELPPSLSELQNANITPVDMPQASIGPGIGIYSRYKKVLESDDSPMTVKTALQIINKELDEFLTEQEGELDPETRFAITWFEQNGMQAGTFGDADNLARARGLSVDDVKHAGIVEASAGKVRLLNRDELDKDWSPSNDSHLTVWECTQHLIRALQEEGEYSGAVLLKQMGPEIADAARDLAYRLFDICDKQGQSREAGAFNALIAVWPDLTARAATISDAELQQEQLSML